MTLVYVFVRCSKHRDAAHFQLPTIPLASLTSFKPVKVSVKTAPAGSMTERSLGWFRGCMGMLTCKEPKVLVPRDATGAEFRDLEHHHPSIFVSCEFM